MGLWRMLKVPDKGLELWRMLDVPDGVWHLDLDLDMVTDLLYTHGLNFGFIS